MMNTILKTAIFSIKIGLCAALIWWAVETGLIVPSEIGDFINHPIRLIIVFLLITASTVVCAIRWWLLLSAQNVDVGWRWAVGTSILSQFGGTFLPGVIGADGIRIGMVLTKINAGRSGAVVSVFFDRLFGVIGLFILSSLFFVIELKEVLARPDLRPIGIGAAIGTVALALAIILMLQGGMFQERLPAVAKKALAALGSYRRQQRVLWASLALSVLAHLLILIAFYVFTGTGYYPMPLLPLGFAFMASLVANFLPITPGGLGIGEVAFAYLCQIFGGTPGVPYATLFLAFRAVTAIALLLMALPVLQTVQWPRAFEFWKRPRPTMDSQASD
jgi:uncharacterized protein (TIRG00374 family)